MRATDDRIHGSIFLPVLDCVTPFFKMRCFDVFLKSLFVSVDFIEPDPVGIFRVLNNIESHAARFILQRPSSVFNHFLDKVLPVTVLDLKRCNDYIHDGS